MAFAEVPTFISRLREREAVAALALEFIILTAARTGETLGARWPEIDLKAKVWTVPAERMKRGVEHRVPLCQRAIEILNAMAKVARSDLVFPAYRLDRPMSDMACNMLLRRLKVKAATTHGFRSGFRDWAGELPASPAKSLRPRSPMPWAMTLSRPIVAAMRWKNAAKLMDAWAQYLSKPDRSHYECRHACDEPDMARDRRG